MITRLRTAVGMMLIISVVTAAANPSWAVSWGVDVWNLPELQEQARAAAEQEHELDSEYMEVRDRIETKEKLVSGLIAGRISLADVAAQFTVLNDGYEDHMNVIRQIYPGVRDEEKMLWNVADYAQLRLGHLPAWERFAILARLQTEIQTLSVESAAVEVN